jgi:hypothetical protein
LHHAEVLLRDFINTEALCHADSIILMHDCLPLNKRMAEREYRLDVSEDHATRGFWTGDVWKVLLTLKKLRPDLTIRSADCPPTGLLIITGLNSKSRLLSERYTDIVKDYPDATLSLDEIWSAFPPMSTRHMSPEVLVGLYGIRSRAISLASRRWGGAGRLVERTPSRAAPASIMADRASACSSLAGDPDDSLDAIGIRHGTDKASFHHNFLIFYERFFAPLRGRSDLKLLEIGIYDGASLRTWSDYFPHARITGVDIDPSTKCHATARTMIEIADQSNTASLVNVAIHNGPFDIIIDDGSHFWDHQITSFRCLFPFVKPGGYYVVEDLDTSYGSYIPIYQRTATEPMSKYLHSLCDYLVGDAALDISQEADAFIRSYAPITEFMAFYRRTCVIRRKA